MKLGSGISIRESQVKAWLKNVGFKGEYLLVSTKPDSIYSKKLAVLKPNQKLIVDLYTPIFLEKELTLSKWKPQDWLQRWTNKKMVKKFLQRGNHFLVANHRQKEYWLNTARDLGVLLQANDVSVLPTGVGKITSYELRVTNYARRNIVLWFGGVYPWTDPIPLIKAFAKLAVKFPDWKLRILGGFHPQTGYIKRYQKILDFTERLIPEKQLEVIGWQPAESLGRYFNDTAVAVHLVKRTDEDYYAHRVRLLTLLGAGIPVITGGRDAVSDLIDEIEAGVKTEGSVDDLADKLKMVMSDSKILAVWRLQTFKVWKLLKEREYIPVK